MACTASSPEKSLVVVSAILSSSVCAHNQLLPSLPNTDVFYVVEDVKDYVDAFSEISAPAATIGEQLRKISARVSKLVQLGGPVGSLAALAMQKALEPESEEMVALKLLHTTMVKRFDGLDRRVEHLGNRLVQHMALVEYDQTITHPIDIISRVYKKVIDPDRNRQTYRQQFINFCTYNYSPHNSLIWLNERVNLGCVLPTQEEATVYVQAQQVFDFVDKNASKFELLSPERYSDFRLRIISAVSMAKNIALLDSINQKMHGKSINALENAIIEMRHSVTQLNVGGIMPDYERTNNPRRCILNEITTANEDVREALFEMILMIELDALKLVSIGTLCANVSHSGDKKETLDELSELGTLGINITTSMRLYSEKKLATAWPTLMLHYAERTYGSLQSPGIDANTSRAIKFAMDQRGPFKAHQAYSYVYGNADRIRDIMRDICYEEELSLPECLNRIKRKFPALRAFATYRSLLFLHTRGIRKSDATIPTAVTSFTTAGGTQTTQLVKLFHNPGITSMAHFYKLFFFLIAALFPILLFDSVHFSIGIENVWPPNHAAINEQRKHIDVDRQRAKDAAGGENGTKWGKGTNGQKKRTNGDKERAVVDLLTERKQLAASAHGNVAAAETSDGKRAQVQRFGDKGGIAQVEGHSAQLKTKENAEGRHALLKADGKYELDTMAKGSLNETKDTEFEAHNDRFDFGLNPAAQDKTQGHGTLSFADKGKRMWEKETEEEIVQGDERVGEGKDEIVQGKENAPGGWKKGLYWQKQGTIDVWMKFFERAPNRAEMEKEFFSQLDNPLLGKAFKLAIIGEWLAANSLDQGSYTPTNSELLEFWVSKRAPDRLLACEHGVVDYEIEGSKVKTNVLFEAATTAGNLPNIFKNKKCAAFEKLQEERFKQEVHEFKQRGGGGGIFGGIGNLFRSGGR
ncbi:hypothetical protein niasHT_000204 [Heterodera trifolii]|uniref:Uncharacterized protein n=1 Tax=Heterodera trifolii TaxID=157864 RepID=A0ABD2LXE8_9BILA